MSTLASLSPVRAPVAAPIQTLADLMERIGNVPLNRVRAHPAPGTAVEKDVLGFAANGVRCELVDGVLVEKAMSFTESVLAMFIGRKLDDFVRPRNLGVITGEQCTVRLFAGLVRIPDVAFTCWDRLPGGRLPREPIPNLAPDLAVEVLSLSNTKAEMKRKRHDYFSTGVRLVWQVDPEARTVEVYTSKSRIKRRTDGDLLDGGAVLPGFELPVRDLFAELDRHG